MVLRPRFEDALIDLYNVPQSQISKIGNSKISLDRFDDSALSNLNTEVSYELNKARKESAESKIEIQFNIGKLVFTPDSGVETTMSMLEDIQSDKYSITCGDVATKEKPVPFADNVRLRLGAETLGFQRDDTGTIKDYAALPGANLAIVSNRQAVRLSFDAQLALGYAFQSNLQRQIIPFVSYRRAYIDAKSPPANSNINNLGFGVRFQNDEFFPGDTIAGDVIAGDVFVQPQYVRKLSSGAEVFQLDSGFIWAPFWPVLGRFQELWNSVYARAYVDIPLTIGKVLHTAGEASLNDTNEFLRSGGHIRLMFLCINPGSWSDGASITFEHTQLVGFIGHFNDVHRTLLRADYTLPKTKFISLSFEYRQGKDLVTLEKENTYKLALGVKY